MPAKPRSAVEALRPLLTGEAFGQLVRFAVAGVGVTLLSTLVYLAAAMPFHVAPLLANALSYLVGVGVGYAIHSRWSFRVGGGGNDRAMATRFFFASAAAFALNSLWVWLAVHVMHLPAWTPVTAMIFATPLGSFALNRYWVFG